jgi:non-specific serine/threonine protein kinase
LNFALSVENAAQVAEICRRLDGLPLAIELAAARVRLLKPPEILRRLANPLQILTSRVEDLPARQRTMRDTIAWSYNLLGKREKTLFKRLAIFSGGFTLEAAEAICGNDSCGAEVLDDLESLISGNLLRQTEDRAGDTRLLMLETIREFAAERLAENAEEESRMRRRHADFFLARVRQIERDLFGARQAEMLDRMEADRDNFRQAMDWYRKIDGENELKLAAALTPLYTFRGYLSEGVERLSEAVERNPNAARAARAKALASLGQLIWVKGDYARAIAVCEESLSLARQINYPMISALSLFFAGMSYWYQYNDAEKSIAYLEESLNLYDELEFDSGVVFASVVLAAIYQTNNDLTRAAQLLDASMAAAERTGNNLACSIALVNYGRLKFAEGDFARAKQLCRESLRLREELSDKWGLVQCLMPLAAIAAIEGEPRRAAKILGAIDRLLDALNATQPPIFRADHAPSLKAARRALDEKSFAASFAEGRELSNKEIVEFALSAFET